MTHKWFLLISAFVFLTACSKTDPVIQAEPTQEDKETPEARESERETEDILTVEEILSKSLGELQHVESLSSTKELTQHISLPNEDPFSTTTSLYTEVIQDPISMYRKRVSEVPIMGDFITDIYVVEDGIYFRDGLEDTWFTYPEDVTYEVIAIEEAQVNPQEQHLELLARYAEQLTFEETDTHFILSFKGNPDVLTAFALELNNLMLDELATELEEFMTMADIQKLEYKLFIEKETYLQTEWTMSLVLDLTLEEDSIQREIHVTESLEQFNEISEIIVPQEALDHAEEFNQYFSEFEDLHNFDMNDFKHVEDPINY
ncbi:DUF6612 family protein [Halalkalibacter okhensis]|uniref:Lipoprotein n=1 Tax=Halalkalibacter okhensis TaxID=333138 RepID=A0A0B0IAH0_9BACI|nr:DUF6612 family protein [Halalkalibacter okhensis]KHF37822.1 hypothetical protein LQ50_25100 [Halalkalibacter okhensis]